MIPKSGISYLMLLFVPEMICCFIPLYVSSNTLSIQQQRMNDSSCYKSNNNQRIFLPKLMVSSSLEQPFGDDGDILQSTTLTTTGKSSERSGNSERSKKNNVKIKFGTVQNANVTRSDDEQQRQSQKATEDQGRRIHIVDRLQTAKDPSFQSGEDVLTQEWYDLFLADCAAIDEWEYFSKVIDLMKERGLKPNHNSYKVCLQACYNVSNAASANEIILTMQRDEEIVLDESDISSALLTMCRKELLDKGGMWGRKAYQLFKQYEHYNIPILVYDALLACMADEKQWQDAIRLLRSIEDKQQKDGNDGPEIQITLPATSTYRIVIECCLRCNQIEQGVQILQSCIRQGLTPSIYTFELVINELSKKLQWRRAVQLLDVIEHELCIQPTVQIYNSIISACSKAREVAQAKNLLNRMRKADKIKPTIISYNSVIAACASTSQWKDALHILDLLQREPGVTPDVYTYTNAIRACAKGGQTQKALAIFQVVKDKRLPLDSYFYTAVIEACSKGGLWQRALDLLSEMEEKGINPSEFTFNVAITACGNGGQWQKALELLSTMRERRIPTNLYVYNAAITAVSKAAKRKIKSTISDDPRESQQLYTEVLSLLDQMRKDGIEPDGFSFSSAISCCGSEGRWKEALELIELMQKGGSQPNKVAYTSAISSCGRSGQVDHAIKLFRQMKEQGSQVDRVAYNALFSALRIAKKSEAAFDLWNEMLGTTDSSTTRITRTGTLPVATPDIITVTDAIAAMASESDQSDTRDKVDMVFAEAVRRSIVLRKMNHAALNREIDLSGMSFPVARAACRYVLNRILSDSSASRHESEVVFITGVGASHDDGSSTLRDYVQEIFMTDFSPPIESFVPDQERSTVRLKAKTLAFWIGRQQK